MTKIALVAIDVLGFTQADNEKLLLACAAVVGVGVAVGVEVGVEGKLEDGAGERLRGGEISKWRGWE